MSSVDVCARGVSVLVDVAADAGGRDDIAARAALPCIAKCMVQHAASAMVQTACCGVLVHMAAEPRRCAELVELGMVRSCVAALVAHGGDGDCVVNAAWALSNAFEAGAVASAMRLAAAEVIPAAIRALHHDFESPAVYTQLVRLLRCCYCASDGAGAAAAVSHTRDVVTDAARRFPDDADLQRQCELLLSCVVEATVDCAPKSAAAASTRTPT